MRLSIINGLLRYGETAHMTGDLKAGKGWLLFDLALSQGSTWLGEFSYPPAIVLIVDAKCYTETMAFRLNAIDDAKGSRPTKRITACSARGKAITLAGIFDRGKDCDLVFVNGLDETLPNGMGYAKADEAIRRFAERHNTGWMDTRRERSLTGGTHLHLSRAATSENAILHVCETAETKTEIPLVWRFPLWRRELGEDSGCDFINFD